MRACALVLAATAAALGRSCALPIGCGNVQPIPELSASEQAVLGPGAALRQVQVMVRHGDRTVARGSPCWAHDDVTWDCQLGQLQATTLDDTAGALSAPRLYRQRFQAGIEAFAGTCGAGQLTAKGYQQHLANGANLYDAYVTRAGLLPASLGDDPTVLFARSDNEGRTIKSGQALLTGMWAPHAGPTNAAEVVDWWVRDSQTENLVFNKAACPAITAAIVAANSSAAGQAEWAKVGTLLDQLSAATGGPVTDVMHTADCLLVHACHEKTIPAGITQALFDAAWNASTSIIGLQMQASDNLASRLGMGNLVNEVWTHMKAAMAGTAGTPKMLLYAGHDTGPIMPVLAVFKVWDGVWVPYASLISFELYQGGGGASWWVRMIFNGQVMHIPGCATTLCTSAEFAAIVKAIVPTAAQCGNAGERAWGGLI